MRKRCVAVMGFMVLFLGSVSGFAQVDSSTDRTMPIASPLSQRTGRPQLAYIIEDLCWGGIRLDFSRKADKLRDESRSGLESMLLRARGGTGADSVNTPLRLILLLEREPDRVLRMERIAAIAAALQNNCNALEISCLENPAEIAYYKGFIVPVPRSRKHAIQAVLTSVSPNSQSRETIDRRSSLLVCVCDVLPE